MMELSISKIKAFKACRRMYQLKYIEHVEPVQYSEALEIGRNYHEMIDSFYKGEKVTETFTKESAMFAAYKKYIAPNFKMIDSEYCMKKNMKKYYIDVDFVGIADGIAEDGYLVEHKTTGGDVGEMYEYNLQWDEQILAYMWLSGSRKIWYTVCKKPTIRQKQNETDEEFYRRMVEWYDDDTENKIRVIEIKRSDEEVEEFEKKLLAMCFEIDNAYATENYYRNTCHCQTWGTRCEYSPICLNYNPDENYVGFIKNY